VALKTIPKFPSHDHLNWGRFKNHPVYTGWSNVTESMVTIRSPFVGITRHNAFLLNGQDISCYSNKIESVSLRKCPYDQWQGVFKRNHSDEHFSDFLPTRWRQKSTGIDMEQNYVTVTLCIFQRSGSHWISRSGDQFSWVQLICAVDRPHASALCLSRGPRQMLERRGPRLSPKCTAPWFLRRRRVSSDRRSVLTTAD